MTIDAPGLLLATALFALGMLLLLLVLRAIHSDRLPLLISGQFGLVASRQTSPLGFWLLVALFGGLGLLLPVIAVTTLAGG